MIDLPKITRRENTKMVDSNDTEMGLSHQPEKRSGFYFLAHFNLLILLVQTLGRGMTRSVPYLSYDMNMYVVAIVPILNKRSHLAH